MTRNTPLKLSPEVFPWATDFPTAEMARLAMGQAAEAFYRPLIDAELDRITQTLAQAERTQPDKLPQVPLGGRTFGHIALWGNHLEGLTPDQLEELHISEPDVEKFSTYLRQTGLVPLATSVEIHPVSVTENLLQGATPERLVA